MWLGPLPLLCDRRDHRVSAATTGVCSSCAARSMTGRLCVNPEQRAARSMPGQQYVNPERQQRGALSPHSPPLRRRMRLRARGARDEPEPAEPEPAEPAAPPSAEPERGECSPRPRPRVPRSERPPLPAFSVRSPSWEPRRDPRERDASEEEAEEPRAERPRPPREPPRDPERDPPRPPRPRPSERGDEPPRSSRTSASRPARVRLARGRRPVVPSGMSRSVNR